MNLSFYETIELDESFPLTFHEDKIAPNTPINLPHWHEHIELLYFRQGEGTVYMDAEPHAVSPGMLAVIPSSALHTIETTDLAISYDCLIVDWGYCSERGFSETGVPPTLQDDEIAGVFDSLRREMAEKNPQYQNAAQGLVLYLLSLIYRRYGNTGLRPVRSGKHDTVRAVMGYLKEHLSEPISMEEVAGKFGFSKYYFCRLFREGTGMTAVTYLNRARCIEARNILRTSDAPIARVAERCGFDNPAYFAKTYQKLFGCSPKEDRKG